MGSYDYSVNTVVNFSMINCRMNHINDRTRWGVIGTNFCKDIKPAQRPFPYERCQRLRVRGLTTANGKKPRVSTNAQIENSVVLIEGEG